MESELNWDQRKAIELESKLPELSNYLLSIGREEKSKEILNQILQEERESEDGELRRKEVREAYVDLVTDQPKKWGEASELLVEYVKGKMHIYTTKDDNKSEIWIYKQGIYVPQGRSEIKIVLRELLGKWYSQYIFNLVIAKIEPDTSIDSEVFFRNNYVNEVAVENGILNLFTKQLSPFSPKKIFFNKLPVEYNPLTDCPQVEKFLNDVLPEEDDKNVIYEIGGFCLLNEYKFEKAFMFVGDGRNGKDKTIELFKRVIGIENCASIPLASLNPESFVISELFSKKANLAGEISNKDLKDTTSFKALTGRSLISAKRKFLPEIKFVNHAKFIFACNELPMVYDTSRGFWERWVLLEFANTFVSKSEYDSAEDNSNLKVRDEDIINKITTPSELSGLLNKFLEGLDRLLENRDFSLTKGTSDIKDIWIRKSNSFIAFCMDKLEEEADSRINKKKLRKEYIKYCKEHKVRPKSDVVIKNVLQNEFGASEEQSSSDFGERFWTGIKWKLTK